MGWERRDMEGVEREGLCVTTCARRTTSAKGQRKAQGSACRGSQVCSTTGCHKRPETVAAERMVAEKRAAEKVAAKERWARARFSEEEKLTAGLRRLRGTA